MDNGFSLDVVISGEWQKVTQKAVRCRLCGVCGRGIGNKLIECRSYQTGYRRCSGIKGSMCKVMKTFVCRGCVNSVTGTDAQV